jgi:hypothetical protein
MCAPRVAGETRGRPADRVARSLLEQLKLPTGVVTGRLAQSDERDEGIGRLQRSPRTSSTTCTGWVTQTKTVPSSARFRTCFPRNPDGSAPRRLAGYAQEPRFSAGGGFLTFEGDLMEGRPSANVGRAASALDSQTSGARAGRSGLVALRSDTGLRARAVGRLLLAQDPSQWHRAASSEAGVRARLVDQEPHRVRRRHPNRHDGPRGRAPPSPPCRRIAALVARRAVDCLLTRSSPWTLRHRDHACRRVAPSHRDSRPVGWVASLVAHRAANRLRPPQPQDGTRADRRDAD